MFDLHKIYSACGGAPKASLRKCLGAKEHVSVCVGMCRAHHDWGTACAKAQKQGEHVLKTESLGMIGMQGADVER